MAEKVFHQILNNDAVTSFYIFSVDCHRCNKIILSFFEVEWYSIDNGLDDLCLLLFHGIWKEGGNKFNYLDRICHRTTGT
ncbi:hypothetical protein [Bacteroides sp.]|uniref:hypothetical protein n=1 Tax=Bacteroides sp. TaxID=29523 RepID=UPI0023C8AED4|nr:hypothetical protein [Bacteroides sp.]MDE5710910.1 hypothetical protein [Bacteroides sp.]MDE5761704.1 hypothetical protein [Bacteroides sp.]MDE6215730.1 hypothetical protein [Bacteroides sp.]